MAERLQLVRDILDKQLVDAKGDPMGKVDGIVLDLGDGTGPPRAATIACGFPVLGARLHPRLGRWIIALGRRWGMRGGRTYRIPFSRVEHFNGEVKLSIKDAERTPAYEWEHWLREKVFRHVPGGGGGGGDGGGGGGGK
jgi:hypothetical protein